MQAWSPISEAELTEVIERQLHGCTDEQREMFSRLRVSRSAPIERFGAIENAWVVAENRGEVMYYEDVEEGFNISSLAADGSIASPGFEQWDLCQALLHWSGRHPTTGANGV
jgi:hypothetical protein